MNMESFKFNLDVKSFFVGIKNDTRGGHTATVSTNLKQGPTIKKELEYFMELNNIIPAERNDELIQACSFRSKSYVKIIKCLYFNKIYVNGERLDTDYEFAIYLKEEINPSAVQYGRIKLHYPFTFKYTDFDHDINNKEVLKAIRGLVGNYAFIVNSFRLYFNDSRIDLDITIIGEEDIPYSKVYIDQKGTGDKFNKLFTQQSDTYDYEIVAVKRYVSEDIGPTEYSNMLSSFDEKAASIVYNHLENSGYKDINDIISKYPYSPVDMEYYINELKYYIIIKTTATNMDYFFLSKYEWQLICSNPNRCKVILVKKICSEKPLIEEFNLKQIELMNKEITAMRVYK